MFFFSSTGIKSSGVITAWAAVPSSELGWDGGFTQLKLKLYLHRLTVSGFDLLHKLINLKNLKEEFRLIGGRFYASQP